MPIIELEIDRNGADYQANCQAMLKQIDEVAAIKQKVLERSLQEKPKFTKRGKMLPHERVQHLLDAGSPFVELCGLAGYMLDDDKDGTEAGGNMIAGIFYILEPSLRNKYTFYFGVGGAVITGLLTNIILHIPLQQFSLVSFFIAICGASFIVFTVGFRKM